MITVTDEAAKALQEFAESEGFVGALLRIKILGGGCAGFSYDLTFESTPPTEMDEVFTDKGVSIVVDQLSLQYVDGSCVDFIKQGLMGTGFKVNNPNVRSTCGCGSSFDVNT